MHYTTAFLCNITYTLAFTRCIFIHFHLQSLHSLPLIQSQFPLIFIDYTCIPNNTSSTNPRPHLQQMASQNATTTAVEVGPDSEKHQPRDRPVRNLQPVQIKTTSPPPPSTPSHRRIAIAVDLSEESAYAVKWAVENYIRPRDVVILLHVQSTSILYGADWGSSTPTTIPNASSQEQLDEELDNFTTTKANQLAQPLVDASVPFKLRIVKDHDMEERLCLEIERLNLSVVIMGSRGIGAARRSGKGKLGSVSDYCVQHCVCPVVVVRYNTDNNHAQYKAPAVVAEEEQECDFHDADDGHHK